MSLAKNVSALAAMFVPLCGLMALAGDGDKKIVYRENVVYGQVHGAGLLADVAFPESKERLPAIISVHGGRWKGGHRRDASSIKVNAILPSGSRRNKSLHSVAHPIS